MTTAAPSSTTARSARRADGRIAGLLAAGVLVVVAAAWILTVASPAPRSATVPRVALIVDAGPRPDHALARARSAARRTERAGAAEVSVRLPRSAAEASTDVRYFAAQGYDAVVAVGPVARAAVRASGAVPPGARVATPAGVPRTVR